MKKIVIIGIFTVLVNPFLCGMKRTIPADLSERPAKKSRVELDRKPKKSYKQKNPEHYQKPKSVEQPILLNKEIICEGYRILMNPNGSAIMGREKFNLFKSIYQEYRATGDPEKELLLQRMLDAKYAKS